MDQKGKLKMYLLFGQFNKLSQPIIIFFYFSSQWSMILQTAAEGEIPWCMGMGTFSRPRDSSPGVHGLLLPHTLVALESHLTCWSFSSGISITLHYRSKDGVTKKEQISRHCTILTICLAHFSPFLPTFSDYIIKPLNISFLPSSRSRHLGPRPPSENTTRPWVTNFIFAFNTLMSRGFFFFFSLSLISYLEKICKCCAANSWLCEGGDCLSCSLLYGKAQ